MPLVGVFAAPLTGLGRQQMLEGPKDKRDPGAAPPPADQLRGTPRRLQTQQREAIVVRFVHDDYRHFPIGGAGSPQPHVADARLPGMLPPRPPLAMDQGRPFNPTTTSVAERSFPFLNLVEMLSQPST